MNDAWPGVHSKNVVEEKNSSPGGAMMDRIDDGRNDDDGMY